MPPKRSTSSRISRTTSSKRNFDRSGPSFSAIDVESATSATSTETIRRSPAATDMVNVYAAGIAGARRRRRPRGRQYGAMKLHGIHHVTAITGDAPQNVEFYAGTLGLRLVKKSVNQDDPTVYHLFYADELGTPGSDMTFFEYPGAARGRAGNGMVHRVVFRVADEAALDFWERRVGGERTDGSLVFADPEGLALELVVDDSDDPPLVAHHPEIPKEHAIRGFAGVRAYAAAPEASAPFLEALGFDGGWEVRGEQRR